MKVDLDKVVLARDLIIDTSTEIDVRYILRQLSRTFDDCWTYYVDGLVGATPEMLVRKRGVNVISRVLAGTIAQSRDQEQNAQLQAKLLASDKDQQEHDYAVESVAAALIEIFPLNTVAVSPCGKDIEPDAFERIYV